MTEYSYQKFFEQDASLSSFAQFGGVWRQQDSNNTLGTEVSGGFELSNRNGIEISGNGQYLRDQTEDFLENVGVKGEIRFDKNYDQLGLQAKISPRYGSISNQKVSNSGIWHIFGRNLTQNSPNTNITSEIAWGLYVGDNAVTITPYYQLT